MSAWKTSLQMKPKTSITSKSNRMYGACTETLPGVNRYRILLDCNNIDFGFSSNNTVLLNVMMVRQKIQQAYNGDVHITRKSVSDVRYARCNSIPFTSVRYICCSSTAVRHMRMLHNSITSLRIHWVKKKDTFLNRSEVVQNQTSISYPTE